MQVEVNNQKKVPYFHTKCRLWAVVLRWTRAQRSQVHLARRRECRNGQRVADVPLSTTHILVVGSSCSTEPNRNFCKCRNGAKVDRDLVAIVPLIVQLQERHWKRHVGSIQRPLETCQTNTTQDSTRTPSLRRCRPNTLHLCHHGRHGGHRTQHC